MEVTKWVQLHQFSIWKHDRKLKSLCMVAGKRNAATLLLVSVCRACYMWASDTVLLWNLLQMGLTHRLGYTRCDTVLLWGEGGLLFLCACVLYGDAQYISWQSGKFYTSYWSYLTRKTSNIRCAFSEVLIEQGVCVFVVGFFFFFWINLTSIIHFDF